MKQREAWKLITANNKNPRRRKGIEFDYTVKVWANQER